MQCKELEAVVPPTSEVLTALLPGRCEGRHSVTLGCVDLTKAKVAGFWLGTSLKVALCPKVCVAISEASNAKVVAVASRDKAKAEPAVRRLFCNAMLSLRGSGADAQCACAGRLHSAADWFKDEVGV
eukprot:4848814-Amphidinium_carterae.1